MYMLVVAVPQSKFKTDKISLTPFVGEIPSLIKYRVHIHQYMYSSFNQFIKL